MYTQDFALCQHYMLVTIAGHRHAIHAFRYRTEPFLGPFRYWTKGLSFWYYIQYWTNICCDIWYLKNLAVYMGISCTCSAKYISGKIADSSCGKGTCLLFWISDIRFIQYQLNLYRISQSDIWYQSSVRYQMFRYRTEKLNIGF
jgi:hypothetical protein